MLLIRRLGEPLNMDAIANWDIKDLLYRLIAHDSKDRSSAEEILRHPFLYTSEETTGDVLSYVDRDKLAEWCNRYKPLLTSAIAASKSSNLSNEEAILKII